MKRNTLLTACGTFVIGALAGVLVMTNDGAHGAIQQALYGGTSNAVGAAAERRSSTAVLYFGNLPWAVTTEDLTNAVSAYSEVISTRIATDRETGRSRGFGFVEVPADKAQTVIDALNNSEWGGRPLTVYQAPERTGTPPKRSR